VTAGLPEPVPATYAYWACDLKTGVKLEPLPLKASGKLPIHIGQLSTATFTCDLSELDADGSSLTPVDFWNVTIPGRSMIACEAQYAGGGSDVVWAGIVLLSSGGSSPDATLQCATPEAFFSRRSIITHTYSKDVPTDSDAKIMADLLADAAVEGLNIAVDVQGTTTRNLRYKAKEYTKALAALQALSDLEDGAEWYIRPAWKTAEQLAVGLTFVGRPRLGSAGNPPNARFDFPGCITDYDTTVDFTEGHGGNAVTPVADGGAAGTVARDEAGIAAGYPRWEQEVSKTGVKTPTELAGLARSTLALNARGQTTHVMSIDASLGTRYLQDFQLGDDVSFIVYGPESPDVAPPSYRHPEGLVETVRVMGVEIDPSNDTFDPILWQPYDGGQ
jgi:hypothetical protein